jgi:hypothetical protein
MRWRKQTRRLHHRDLERRRAGHQPKHETIAYDTLKDLAPVTLVATVPEMLVVATSVPAPI